MVHSHMFSLIRVFDSYYTSSNPHMAIGLEHHGVFQLRPPGITARLMIACIRVKCAGSLLLLGEINSQRGY